MREMSERCAEGWGRGNISGKILVSNCYPTGKRRIYSSKHLLLPQILFRLFHPHPSRLVYSLHIDLPQEDETQQPGVKTSPS